MAKKTQIGYQEIESRLKCFKDNAVAADDVPYRLLYCFGKTDAEIRRWQEGKGVVKAYNGLLIKNLIAYRTSTSMAMTADLEQMKTDPKVLAAKPKIVIVSDGQAILAYDLRENDTYENRLADLCYDFNFFYPLADVERVHNVEESPADVKAAEKLAKLHDEIRAFNEFTSDTDLHDLNIFISRLLFCYFAEDTGIFPDNLFTNSIKSYTLEDGSDLSDYLSEAFAIMDIPEKDRAKDTKAVVKHFPYVNGGLFSYHIQIPTLSRRARKIMVDCGSLDWKEINPDIFGSMIQAVVNPEVRATQGMHYTSVPNILKVINPLFMDELREEFNKIKDVHSGIKERKDLGISSGNQYEQECKPVIQSCQKLLKRMSKMKFFDPACGSGNFLIITYKRLRLLEMEILKLMQECTIQYGLLTQMDSSVITLQQFYGIELQDFPHEMTMLSLWLAQHQMNRKLMKDFGINTHALPLQNITQIRLGNACRMDWNEVCPHTKDEEVFVFGNPPYLGYSKQSEFQKKDIELVCVEIPNCKKLDYIACWFIKASSYIEKSAAMFAFVTTNSITQGEQVALLWPKVLLGNDIYFAYHSFAWKNNAKNNAMVAVSIIGVKNKSKVKIKRIFNDTNSIIVNNISPYIIDYKDIYVVPSDSSISGMPEMIKGSSPVDDGNLLLSEEDKNNLLNECEKLSPYIKRYVGADEFVNGTTRYCLLFDECAPIEELIHQSNSLRLRLQAVESFRKKSTKAGTRQWATKPYCFIERKYRSQSSIVIPQTGSERRRYIPMGIADSETVLSNAVRLIYTGQECDMSLFGILSSYLHMVWVRTVAGRMKTDMQYSNTICYNTFPFPKLTEAKKKEIEAAAEEVLLTREDYPGATLADLYDPDKMPEPLREAHQKLDDVVESCYPGYPFANDEARLECLFKLYEKMTKAKK